MLGFALCLLVFLPVAESYAAKEDLIFKSADKQSNDPTLYLTQGKAEIVDVDSPVSDIMVANPAIADVVALQSNKLYVVGMSIGDTNLIVLNDMGDVVKRLNVHVRLDTNAIEAMLFKLFPNEKNVKVDMVGSQLVLTGKVSSPSVSHKISRLVAAHIGEVSKASGEIDELIENLMDVGGEQQVMLRVRIIEASRNILKELGVETSLNDPVQDASSLTNIFSKAPSANMSGGLTSSLGVANETGLTKAPFAIGSLLWDTTRGGLGFLEVLVNALEEDQLINILAEPNLTSISGEQAGFLAGGEFPVPIGRDRLGNIIIEFREFGVSLNFVPTVLSEDRISLQLNTEVSSLDFGEGLTLADVEIPGIDIRRASTTVELGTGGSLMIAGLLKSEAIKGMTGLPGIRKTPILGDLVSSRSFNQEETELVVIVTPYLVQPYADENQAEPVIPVEVSNPLSLAFVGNIRRIYGDEAADKITKTERIGYILE